MTPFQQRIHEVVGSVPEGRVVTYGSVAALAGSPRAARAVGSTLCALDPDTSLPWWRVVNRNGEISTTCLDHTAQIQRAILEGEGVVFVDGRIDLSEFGWVPEGLDLEVD